MTETKLQNEHSAFDEIMEEIGNAGPFQKRFSYIFVTGVAMMVSMQFLSKILSLSVPDHWCHVSGRENTSYTIEEWKNLTIPMTDFNGVVSYSKCTRFLNHYDKNETVKCDDGWEYDHSWYEMTASMQNNWVCDDFMVPTNVLALNRVSEIIGTLVLGQLADNIGRRPVFFICIGILFIGRLINTFTSSWIYVFFISSFICSLPSTSTFHSTYIINVEISAVDKRAFVNMLFGLGWAIGVTITPLIMWCQPEWITFNLITITPLAIFVLMQNWMIESPRWLASRGNIVSCIKVLKAIARTNKTEVPYNIAERLRAFYDNEGKPKIQTVLNLFSSLRLSKNVSILVYGMATTTAVYLCFLLGISNLAGNPYLNYFFMGLIDLPMFISTKYVCDRFGRRLVVILSLFLIVIGCFTMVAFIPDQSLIVVMIVVCILTKGICSVAYAAMGLQVVEICPTCVRQTGTSLASVIANVFCVCAPYIVTLGISGNVRIPYVIYGVLIVIGFIGSIFLPETLGEELPDTLEEAAKFGADQDFWGLSKYRRCTEASSIPLNSIN